MADSRQIPWRAAQGAGVRDNGAAALGRVGLGGAALGPADLPLDPALRGLGERDALALLLQRCGGGKREPAAADLLAARVLARFGDWPRVMGATLAELTAVAGPSVAQDLRLLCHLLVRGLAYPLRRRSVLDSGEAVRGYLRASLAGRGRECFRVLFLDKRHHLILDDLLGEGTVDHAPVYPREVMRRALELNASGCCLVHNHPSGSAQPSAADIAMTQAVVAAGHALAIPVHDHFLVAGQAVVSFKSLGLI